MIHVNITALLSCVYPIAIVS